MVSKKINIFDRVRHHGNEKKANKNSFWLDNLHLQEEPEARHFNTLIGTKGGAQSAIQNSISHGLPQSETNEKSPYQKGIEEHVKAKSMKVESDREAINEIIRKSDRLIASVSSVSPFAIFSDTIEIEESRVVLVFRQFMSSQSHSVDIKDIANVFIENAIFFSTIQMVSRTFTQNDIKIGFLRKKDALYARKIIEGLRFFSQKGVDTSRFERQELLVKLEEVSIQR